MREKPVRSKGVDKEWRGMKDKIKEAPEEIGEEKRRKKKRW